MAFPPRSHDGCSASGKVCAFKVGRMGVGSTSTSVPFIKKGCPRSPSANFSLHLTDHSCVIWRPVAKEAEKINTLPASKVEVGKTKEVWARCWSGQWTVWHECVYMTTEKKGVESQRCSMAGTGGSKWENGTGAEVETIGTFFIFF